MKCHAVWGIWLNCTWVAICWNIFPPDRSPDWADWRSFSYYPITCAILIRKPSTDYPISSGWLSTTIFSPFYLPASSTNAPNSKECNPFPSMNSIIILSCQFIIGWVNSMDSLISFLFFSVLFFPFCFFFFSTDNWTATNSCSCTRAHSIQCQICSTSIWLRIRGIAIAPFSIWPSNQCFSCLLCIHQIW